jgi:hypothetical protein
MDDVLGIERSVEQRAQDRVMPGRGLACGRDREPSAAPFAHNRHW